ncbi:MAG: hypothetical protein JKY54_13105, partial [Flavobacteriales bacterium]|nr:hypothetical protein [Flavobacteriales bacterium]
GDQGNGGCYVYADTAPEDADTFLTNVATAQDELNTRYQSTDRYVIWMQIDDADQTTTVLSYIAFVSDGGDALTGKTTQLTAINLLQMQLQIDPDVVMTLEEDSDSAVLAFSQSGTSFKRIRVLDQYDGVSNVASCEAVGINMGDNDLGQLAFGGLFLEAILSTPVGFQYACSADTSSDFEALDLYYPLCNEDVGLYNWDYKALWNLFKPLDASETYWFLIPDDAPLATTFRTVLGEIVLLTPLGDSSCALAFNQLSEGVYYLAPSGSYTISVDEGVGVTSDLQNKLLCGLSGVEYLSFTPGDLLHFISSQNASVLVSVEDDAYSFQFNGDATGITTSYITILPQDGSESNYYSEPEQAPFFAGEEVTDVQLDYFELSRSSLTDDTSFTGFPMVAYAKFDDSGLEENFAKNIEFQLYNPTRNQLIEDNQQDSQEVEQIQELQTQGKQKDRKGKHRKHKRALRKHLSRGCKTAQNLQVSVDVESVSAVTPQGYISTFEGDLWTTLQIANKQISGSAQTNVQIGFTPGSGEDEISDALQNAFLTNQQFVVITQGYQLGTFVNDITMSDWPFTLDPSVNESVGEYRNVILFKSSSDSTIQELVKQPELWTGREDFTDTAVDVNGTFISQWLQDYFTEAISLYDNGNGVTSLQGFCELIQNPLWNGFLALKVDVSTDELPTEVEALLAGIDKSLFYGHHIGVQINHLSVENAQTSGLDLTSSVFGLVHYVDPNIPDVNNISTYYSSPADYNFTVLTLEAVFEKGVLVNFSNKSMLLINKFFGDTVLETSANGESGANNLILLGIYSDQGGESSYTFSTAQGSISTFYLSSNAFYAIPVNRATMTVQETGTDSDGETTYESRFGLWGSMETLPYEDFDLLSYAQLSFSNLFVDMAFDSGGTDPVFTFDSNSIALALNQNKIYTGADDEASGGYNLIRSGSLLTQFPLELKGLYQGTSDKQPDSLGYLTLLSEDPTGIVTADLSGGDWYAFQFSLNLGGQGAMANNAGLSADFLISWSTGGNSQTAIASPSFKLTGPAGVSLTFDLQGVIKFGAKDIVLNRPAVSEGEIPQFIMIFQSLGLTVLSKSFPPEGTTNVILFGDTTDQTSGIIKPTLGWFGGYVEQEASS